MEKITTVDRTMMIDAPPSAVWKALTDLSLIRLYRMNSSMDGDWQKGGWCAGSS